jgi:heme A synthase
MSNVVLSWPLVAAVLHSGGGALLVAMLVTLNFYAARARSR